MASFFTMARKQRMQARGQTRTDCSHWTGPRRLLIIVVAQQIRGPMLRSPELLTMIISGAFQNRKKHPSAYLIYYPNLEPVHLVRHNVRFVQKTEKIEGRHLSSRRFHSFFRQCSIQHPLE
jgi:hypothetical protein